MKYILPIMCFLLLSIAGYTQTDGISYQAVIIDPNPKELPGFEAQGNILPNAAVAIRFTILDANNIEEYQETHTTTTDAFGMINLMIGQGDPTGAGTGDFTLIMWDGTSKNLRVEIDFNGTGNSYVRMDRQELTFVPYAYHRDITATGTLTVDDVTDLNGELRVHGPTNLNSTLDVNNENASNLSGTLTVEGHTDLNNGLLVEGTTDLDSLDISSTLAVEGTSTFMGPALFEAPTEFVELTVNGPSHLEGQVTVRADVDSLGDQNNYEAYPLLVEGSAQGIAIKVNEDRSKDNNFVSFWDDNQMWGQIEGLSLSELENSEEYKWGKGIRFFDLFSAYYDNAKAGFEVGTAIGGVAAALSASTACVGVGACVTAPPPSGIVHAFAVLAVKLADAAVTLVNTAKAAKELEDYVIFRETTIGVTYSSGSGDYAEWLPKQNPSEEFVGGELIGVKNGYVTKDTWGAEKIMIVSTRPIVLGNMPPKNNEENYVKIAFMGQVPAKVLGEVAPGDYILPDELGGGFAKAIHPSDMEIRDYKKIAGVAWSVINEITEGLSIVNVAVGINTNDLSDVVNKQEEELTILRQEYVQLRSELEHFNTILADLVPGYSDAIGFSTAPDSLIAKSNNIEEIQNSIEENIAYSDVNDIVYFEISEEQIEASFQMAREQYQAILDNAKQRNELLLGRSITSINSKILQENDLYTDSQGIPLIPIEEHPFWHQIDTNPAYKAEIIQYIKSTFEKNMHTHKKHSHKFTDLKVKK